MKIHTFYYTQDSKDRFPGFRGEIGLGVLGAFGGLGVGHLGWDVASLKMMKSGNSKTPNIIFAEAWRSVFEQVASRNSNFAQVLCR